jgi:hypothetical protein
LASFQAGFAAAQGGDIRGTPACRSCLLVAGRDQELLHLIDTAPYLSWHYCRFRVRALAAMARTDDAVAYAQDSLGLNDSPAAIVSAYEEILLEAARSYHAP